MNRTCSVGLCDRPARARGLCGMHLARFYRNGTTAPRIRKICSVPDCGRPHKSRGLCAMHVRRLERTGTTDLPVRPERPKPEPKPVVTVDDRFWSKVSQAEALECWLWAAALDPAGYGRFNAGRQGTVLAHRFAYQTLVAEIPPGLVLDHLCRVRNCVNPYHLDPVTAEVNTTRGEGGAEQAARTHCPYGHPYTDENTYISPKSGSRCCITCKRIEAKQRQQRRRESREP